MTSDRKKPGVAFWATVVVVVVLVAYPLSFGPACWISSRTHVGASAVTVIYRPITFAMCRNQALYRAMIWYGEVGADNNWRWVTRATRYLVWMQLYADDDLPGF